MPARPPGPVMAVDEPPDAGAGSEKPHRTRPRELRRRQLVEATIDCIAERGLAETRIADVAARAGMSVGLVNFHFDSKKTLLAETLGYLADEYRQAWIAARAGAGDDPSAQLEALILMHFSPAICNPRRVAVWFAFFGEARSRPVYQELCQRYDNEYREQLTALIGQLVDDSGRARRAAVTLESLLDGLWQNILLSPDQLSADDGCRACLDWLDDLSAPAGRGAPA